MFTNDDLCYLAADLARQASELQGFFSAGPALPPVEIARSAFALEKIKVRLDRLAVSLSAVAKKAAAVEERNGQ